MAAPLSRLKCHVRYFSVSCSLSKETIRKSQKNASSNQWVTRQINDAYVKRAKEEGWRCRSAFKLIEMNDKYKLIQKGDVVIDCGAAPGSWSQVAAHIVHRGDKTGCHSSEQSKHGKVIAIDLQNITAIDNVTVFSKCDFTHAETQNKVLQTMDNKLANVVLNDMAPASSGDNQLDHDKICALCMEVLKFSSQVLRHGGNLVCKVWDGQDRDKLLAIMKRMFNSVKIAKPDASRSESAEMFLIGKDFYLR